jgi:hypothetical protein
MDVWRRFCFSFSLIRFCFFSYVAAIYAFSTWFQGWPPVALRHVILVTEVDDMSRLTPFDKYVHI